MKKETIEKLLKDAFDALYQNHKRLIDDKTNEPSIVGPYVVPWLQDNFREYSVDADYNREGSLDKRVTKVDVNGGVLRPDIIIHMYGPEGENLMAAEVKGYWNREPRHVDEGKLRRLREKHKYKLLYRIELGRDGAEVIPVD